MFYQFKIKIYMTKTQKLGTKNYDKNNQNSALKFFLRRPLL